MRNCIVVLNLSNFTGTLNHGIELPNGGYKKLRADYKRLLEYVVGNRNLLGAFVVSQRDLNASMASNPEKVAANNKFLQSLKPLGWVPVTIEYHGMELTPQKLLDVIWEATNPLLVENSEWKVDPAVTDIIFINGSAAWYDVIVAYYNAQFSTEVAFLNNATNKYLKSEFPFFDITEFLIQSTDVVNQKQQNKKPKTTHSTVGR